MDGVNVPYKRGMEPMVYVGPMYKYAYSGKLTRYLTSMHIYKVCENYHNLELVHEIYTPTLLKYTLPTI